MGPFPRKVVTADKEFTVINEVCSCSHFRTQHYPNSSAPSLQGMFGKGACLYPLCGCGQFTWKGNLISDGSKFTDDFISNIGIPMQIQEWHQDMETMEKELETLQGTIITADNEKLEARNSEDRMRRQLNQRDKDVRVLVDKLSKLTHSVLAVEMEKRSILIDGEKPGLRDLAPKEE